VKRRGELVPKGLWGVATPVDPGEQIVRTTAPVPALFPAGLHRQATRLGTVPVLVKLARSSRSPPLGRPHNGAAPLAAPLLHRRYPSPFVQRAGQRGHHARRGRSDRDRAEDFGLARPIQKEEDTAPRASAAMRRGPVERSGQPIWAILSNSPLRGRRGALCGRRASAHGPGETGKSGLDVRSYRCPEHTKWEHDRGIV